VAVVLAEVGVGVVSTEWELHEHEGYLPPRRDTCVHDGQIICVDDLCRNSSRTLCGLEEGIDFGPGSPWDDEDDDYPWDDDEGAES
jgi:hypothetical protein